MNTKKILLLLFLFSVVLPLTSCKDEDDTIITSKKSDFAVGVEEINKTASTCEIKLTPSDDSTPYVTLVLPRDVYVAFSKENLSKKALEQMSSEAQKKQQTLEQYLNAIQKKGKQTVMLNALNPNTIYTVLTFEREGNKLSKNITNQKFFFSTLVADIKEVNFNTTAKVEGIGVTLKVEPSDKETKYYVVSLKKQIYDQIKEKGMSDQEIMISNLKHKIYNTINTEDELENALKTILNTGDKTFNISGLDADTEYIYMIAGFSVPDVYTFFPNTNIEKGHYTTSKPNLRKHKFNLSYELQPDSDKVKISFDPEDPDLVYMWRYNIVDESTKNLNADQLAKKIMDNTPMIGPWDRNQGKKEFNVPIIKGNEYHVVVYGLNGKNITTYAEMVKFQTGAPANPATLKLDTEITSKSPYTVNITFKPNDNRIYYAMGLIKDGEKDKETLKNQFQKDIYEGYKEFAKVNKGMSILDYVSTYYFHGKQPFEFTDLEPDTSYTLFTFSISNKGEVVKVEATESYTRTSKVSPNITLKPELYGVFDGDQADSTMVQNPEQVRGKAIIVLKYNFQNADLGAAYMVPETFRKVEYDKEKMPDKDVLTKLRQSFRKIEKENPYGFYMAEWNQTQVSIAYGYLNDGTMGPIDRIKVVTTRKNEVKDIKELKKLTSAETPEKNAVLSNNKEILKPLKKSNTSIFAKKNENITFKNFKNKEAIKATVNQQSAKVEKFDFFRIVK
uniref:hypothetical protein n=1 Tax=Ornithobacterium rhinotracheale TaxID=28251 RepID=UPI00129CD361|nr:hypothetical protein [Ornithobacterium rhinotracheale]